MDETPGGSRPPEDDGGGQPRSSDPPGFPPPPATTPPDWGSSPQATVYPLGAGRLIEMTFSVFRFRWRMFVGLAVLAMLPVLLALFAVDALAGDTSTWMNDISDLVANGFRGPVPERLWRSILINLVVGAVAGIGIYVATAALNDAAARTFGGRPASAIGSIRLALSRLRIYIAMWLVVFVVQAVIICIGIFLGTTLLLATSAGGRIVPGPVVFLGLIVVVATAAALLFLSIRWSMSVAVATLESAGAINSLRRSWRLVAGSSWRVLGYVLLWGIVLGLIGGILAVVVTLAISPYRIVGTSVVAIDPVRLAIASFISGVITAGLMPISVIGMTLLYFDLRFRHGEPLPATGEQPAPRGQESAG